MKVEEDSLAVLHELLRNWHQDCLSRRYPERPLACAVLNQDGSESLKGSQDCSVNNNWSLEPIFEWVFFPFVLFLIKFILGIYLMGSTEMTLLLFLLIVYYLGRLGLVASFSFSLDSWG